MKRESKGPSMNSGAAEERDRQAFGQLLDLAEQVESKRESLRGQMLAGISWIAAAAFVLVGSVFLLFKIFFEESPSDEFLYIFSAASAMIAYFVSALLFLTYRRQIRRESVALHEVVSIVNEVFETKKADLTPLEVAEIKIRLGRLDN